MGRKVLVVDDEASVRELLTDILEGHEYEVTTSDNGEEGLAKAKEIMPDIMIVDLMMPKMPGGILAAELQKDEATAHIPIIFLTGMLDKEDADLTGGRIASQIFLPKPFEQAKLLETIKKVLGE